VIDSLVVYKDAGGELEVEHLSNLVECQNSGTSSDLVF
jgi:hypothetical protein